MSRPGEFVRMTDFEDADVPRAAVRRALDAGIIEKVARGVYCLAHGGPEDVTRREVARLAARHPSATLCYMTALRFHDLTDNMSAPWHIALRRTSPVAVDGNVRAVRWSAEEAFTVGIEELTVAGVRVRITSAARTVADMFRQASGFSDEIAHKALASYLRSGREPEEIGRIARQLGSPNAASKLAAFSRTLLSEGLIQADGEESFSFDL